MSYYSLSGKAPIRREAFAVAHQSSGHLYPKEAKTLRSWIKNCLDEHKACKGQGFEGSSSRFYPTRLIDVRSSTIRLVGGDTLNVSDGGYVALSYCWGKSMPESCKTTFSTLRERQRNIEYNSLPKTLREAILVTRELGVPFIWVDCLCIIQGDAEDWEKESASMCQVYAQAVVTIAAGVSNYCDGGFLQPKCGWFQYKFVPEGELREEKAFRSLEPNMQRNALSQRGWTLQERELSTRIIHFTPRWTVWQCREHIFSYHINSRKKPRCQDFHLNKKSSIRPVTFDRCLDTGNVTGHKNFGSLWRTLVRDYSSRYLSNPSDKLAAISGLADALKPLIKSEYLAGLWMNELGNDLLWCRMDDEGTDRHPPYSSYYAPSWSWASTNFRVTYDLYDMTTVSYSSQAQQTSETAIIEAGVLSAGQSSPSEGFIRLLVQVRPILDPRPARAFFCFDDGKTRFEELESPFEATEIPGQEVVSRIESESFICWIASHTYDIMEDGRVWVAGLILQCTSKEKQHYKRIGMAANMPLEWFRGIDRSEIVIF